MRRSLLPAALFFLFAACDAPPSDGVLGTLDAGTPLPAATQYGDAVRATQVCAQSACATCQENLVERDQLCGNCLHTCATSSVPGCLSSCDGLCQPQQGTCVLACSTQCTRFSARFEITAPKDTNVERACLDFIAAREGCGIRYVDPVSFCASNARIFADYLAADYRCAEARACEAEPWATCPDVPSAGTHARYCGEMAKRGRACTGATGAEASLTSLDGLLRPEIAAALAYCERYEDASAYDECVDAWIEAIENVGP